MLFKTVGNKNKPDILFFHAMGVTGESSMPIAEFLKDDYFCIMPTSTVYCKNEDYISKADEINQIEAFLKKNKIQKLKLIVASSLGADLAMDFIKKESVPCEHIFFDGGQFAQINRVTRLIMTPFLFLAIKSLYLSKGKTLKKILWCDDENIKPYFIKAGENIKYKNLLRQMKESLENKPFPKLKREIEERTFWEFGSIEEHFKYRKSVMDSYKYGSFPVFEGFNHMQYQIKDPKGFADMLKSISEKGTLPPLPFLK